MKLNFRIRRSAYRAAMVRALPIESDVLVRGRRVSDLAPDIRVGALMQVVERELATMSPDDAWRAFGMFHHALGALIPHMQRGLTSDLRPDKERVSEPATAPAVASNVISFVDRKDAKARAWRARCVVYFVQQSEPAGNGPIKIGVTGQLERRLRALRSGVPHDLILLATIPGDDTAEYRLHQRFAADRLNGEWFRPSEALLSFIASLPQEAK